MLARTMRMLVQGVEGASSVARLIGSDWNSLASVMPLPGKMLFLHLKMDCQNKALSDLHIKIHPIKPMSP